MKSSNHFLRITSALALVSLTLVQGVRAEAVDATVSSVSGGVKYAPPGSNQYRALEVGDKIEAGSTIRTAPGGSAVVVVVPGAAVQVAGGTDVSLDSMAVNENASGTVKRKAQLSLKEGTVSALIDPKRSKETDFKIQTPQGVAAARGTFYAVTVEKGKTYVGVKHGKVAVNHSPKG